MGRSIEIQFLRNLKHEQAFAREGAGPSLGKTDTRHWDGFLMPCYHLECFLVMEPERRDEDNPSRTTYSYGHPLHRPPNDGNAEIGLFDSLILR